MFLQEKRLIKIYVVRKSEKFDLSPLTCIVFSTSSERRTFSCESTTVEEVAVVAPTNKTTSRKSALIAMLASTAAPILFPTMESGMTVEQSTNEG